MTIEELHIKQVRAQRIRAFYKAYELLQHHSSFSVKEHEHLTAQLTKLRNHIIEDVEDSSDLRKKFLLDFG